MAKWRETRKGYVMKSDKQIRFIFSPYDYTAISASIRDELLSKLLAVGVSAYDVVQINALATQCELAGYSTINYILKVSKNAISSGVSVEEFIKALEEAIEEYITPAPHRPLLIDKNNEVVITWDGKVISGWSDPDKDDEE